MKGKSNAGQFYGKIDKILRGKKQRKMLPSPSNTSLLTLDYAITALVTYQFHELTLICQCLQIQTAVQHWIPKFPNCNIRRISVNVATAAVTV